MRMAQGRTEQTIWVRVGTDTTSDDMGIENSVYIPLVLDFYVDGCVGFALTAQTSKTITFQQFSGTSNVYGIWIKRETDEILYNPYDGYCDAIYHYAYTQADLDPSSALGPTSTPISLETANEVVPDGNVAVYWEQ